MFSKNNQIKKGSFIIFRDDEIDEILGGLKSKPNILSINNHQSLKSDNVLDVEAELKKVDDFLGMSKKPPQKLFSLDNHQNQQTFVSLPKKEAPSLNDLTEIVIELKKMVQLLQFQLTENQMNNDKKLEIIANHFKIILR